jgi:hypothetical protein
MFIATINVNTRKTIHVIAIYKYLTLNFSMFLVHLQKFLDVVPTSCPIVIIGDFNIDMFDQNSTQPNELQTYLDYYSMELWEKEITTIYHSHIDLVSTKALIRRCMSRVVKAYYIIGPTINQYILHKNSQIMSHNNHISKKN